LTYQGNTHLFGTRRLLPWTQDLGNCPLPETNSFHAL